MPTPVSILTIICILLHKHRQTFLVFIRYIRIRISVRLVSIQLFAIFRKSSFHPIKSHLHHHPLFLTIGCLVLIINGHCYKSFIHLYHDCAVSLDLWSLQFFIILLAFAKQGMKLLIQFIALNAIRGLLMNEFVMLNGVESAQGGVLRRKF